MLDCLPSSVQRGAKKAIFEITNAENKEAAEKAVDRFVADYGLKWPKAAAKIVDDRGELLAFYDFPAEHVRHEALITGWAERVHRSPVAAALLKLGAA